MAGVDWATVERQHAEELAAARAEYDAAKEELSSAQAQRDAAQQRVADAHERVYYAKERLEIAELAE